MEKKKKKLGVGGWEKIKQTQNTTQNRKQHPRMFSTHWKY